MKNYFGPFSCPVCASKLELQRSGLSARRFNYDCFCHNCSSNIQIRINCAQAATHLERDIANLDAGWQDPASTPQRAEAAQ